MATFSSSVQLTMTETAYGYSFENAVFTDGHSINNQQAVLYNVASVANNFTARQFSQQLDGVFTGFDTLSTTTVTGFREYVTNSPGQYVDLEGISLLQIDLASLSVSDALSGNDAITGSDSADVLRGFTGSDTIHGGLEADTLYGGRNIADDTDSSDVLNGGRGNDWIYGNYGDDTIYGSGENASNTTGTDIVYGGRGSDVMDGQDEDDFLAGGGGLAHAEDEADSILGGAGEDLIVGNGGNDTIIGGTDTVDADDSADSIFGGLGDDLIYGSGGADFIAGQIGNDTMSGGGGADIFLIETSSGTDTILDFTSGTDRLYVANTLSTGITDFASLNAAASVSGSDLVIDLGDGNSLTLSGMTSLASADVAFASVQSFYDSFTQDVLAMGITI